MGSAEKMAYPGMLAGTEQLGIYPMERLKRVDRPTTRITSDIGRIAINDSGFRQAALGHFGPVVQNQYRSNKEPVNASLRDMTFRFKDMVDGEIASSKAPLPQDPAVLSRHIKSLGYFYRADVVGISELPQWAVYSHDEDGKPVALNHKFAIVVLIDQDYRTTSGSTGHDWISRSPPFRSYVNSALITCMMADYIRKLGYSARAHHLSNDLVVIPPLLLLAGIGEVSRPGIVLNPFLGLRFKAAVVTTDLPLQADKPIDFGLQKFCQNCLKCAVECPPQAIPYGDKVMHNGYEVWKLDYERCLKYRILNQKGDSCGRCIRVCPWNKPAGSLHDGTRWLIQHAPWLDRFIVKMDDVWGYAKPNPKNKWWFDWAMVDGKLRIMK